MASWKKDWELTQAAFDKLLAQLDAEVKRAANKYEDIRNGLIQYFECQGCSSPAELADETINRAARRVFEGVVIQSGKVAAFFRGIARNVLHEYWRSPDAAMVPVDEELLSRRLSQDPSELMDRLAAQRAQERRLDCLESCVEKLPPETRWLIFAYGEGDEGRQIANRKQLADELAIPIPRLRLRVHRIRKGLETCVTDCCEQAAE